MFIEKDSLILFQGDSITDWGRNHDEYHNMGTGFAFISSAMFSALHPELNAKFLNRGIGGHRSLDLVNRWDKDCIDLKPNVVSLLVGVNDTLRRFDENKPTVADEYKANCRKLITEAKEKLGAKIILCEPFLLPVTEEQKTTMREDLDPKIHAIRELAREFNTPFIPFDGIFAAACVKQPPEYWAADGIHPTPAGQALMCKHWLEAVESF